MFGRQPILPADLGGLKLSEQDLPADLQVALEHLNAAALRRQREAVRRNENLRPRPEDAPTFEAGQVVWILSPSALNRRRPLPLAKPWGSQGIVVEKLGATTYRVKKLGGRKVRRYTVERLKAVLTQPDLNGEQEGDAEDSEEAAPPQTRVPAQKAVIGAEYLEDNRMYRVRVVKVTATHITLRYLAGSADYVGRTDRFRLDEWLAQWDWWELARPADPTAVEEGVVARIVGRRRAGRRIEYRVEWRGSGRCEWKAEADLNCPEAVAEFENVQRGQRERADGYAR